MTETMRVLTVRQPWAWAIIHGGKDVENRVRNIAGNYRGPVAIHAGLVFDEPDGNDWELRRAITSEDHGWPASDGEVWASDCVEEDDTRFSPRGAIIGIADLAGAHHADACWTGVALKDGSTHEEHCSLWGDTDVFHLELTNPRALAEPIAFKGALGLRTLDDAVVEQIERQLATTAKEADR